MVCFKKRKREGREGGEERGEKEEGREEEGKTLKTACTNIQLQKIKCFCKSDLEKISLKTTYLLRIILP